MTTPARRNQNPVRPQILQGDAASLAEHPRILASAEFIAYVTQTKLSAERRRDDLQGDIDRLETERKRILADAETSAARLDAEIHSRMLDLAQEQEVIGRADAALLLDIKAIDITQKGIDQ